MGMKRGAGSGGLSAVLERLAARLDGASIKRSEVEAALESVGNRVDLWHRVEGALLQAQIRVVEDVVAAPPVTAPVSATRCAPVRDPIDAARDRLELDRGRPPRRLAKVILTAEEEVGLTLLARPNGSQLDPGGFAALSGEAREAADALLLHNTGLIHSVAKGLGGQGLEYDDLVAHGIPGLIRAIELFDPHRGFKFSTYAINWVRQSISRAIANEGRIVRLPVHVVDAIRQVKAAQERLVMGRTMPCWADIARECHMPVAKVEELLRLAPAVVYLDKPVGNDGVTLGDLLDRPVDDAHVDVYGLTTDDLGDLLDALAEREADVLRRRHGLFPYCESQTLEEIGIAYGITRERIRQIETKALTRMRVLLGLEEKQSRGRKAASGPSLQ